MITESRAKILMVDDQQAKLLSYEAILADLEEDLLSASSANEAMRLLLHEDVALVLMDVNMPALDGFALAGMMREHPRFRTTAIIFISGVHLTDADMIKAYRLGAVDYISVPVVPDILRAKVSIFMQLHRNARDLKRLNTELENRVQERKQAQERAETALIESEKVAVVGRLAASIAHEINNPLEAVTNLLYLANGNTDLASIHHYTKLAEIELRRVSAIASQTLRFHRQTTDPHEIQPDVLIEEILLLYQSKLVNSGVHIHGRCRAPIRVCCLEGEVRQVVINLISNALDAMNRTAGQLYWRVRPGKRWKDGQIGAVVTIADTGTGMSCEAMAKLFTPFFTTKGLTGTGLGLWITKQIVDRHGGSLRLRSSQGTSHHGTVFQLFLPANFVRAADDNHSCAEPALADS